MSEAGHVDDDETPPAGRWKALRERWTSDQWLTGGGLAVAAVAALFPWYVFFNQESFGIRPMVYDTSRDLPEWDGPALVSVSPLALPDRDRLLSETLLDEMVTATVPGMDGTEGSAGEGADEVPSQPFPGTVNFRLLHVSNGRALVEDSAGIYFVRVGSVLPDNSRLERFERRGERWVIVTSNGRMVEQ